MLNLRTTRRAVALLSATIALAGGTMLTAAGTAGAASANGGCRGWTDPGTYPESIQLNACMEPNGQWTAVIRSPETDVVLWYQVMDKPAWQSGEPDYAVTPPTSEGVVNRTTGIFDGTVQVATSHCYYLRVWFVDGSTTYGYAESPGACA